MPPAKDIDDYIARYPQNVQKLLSLMRITVAKAAPAAEETLSWSMPTFKLNGNLVHFAAHKAHIGFYPGPSAIVKFKEEISAYKWAKGSVQFPLTQPLPTALITRIVKFRVTENLSKPKKR